MSQLIDYDLRLTDPARIVYRFLIGWYMRSNGDALASVRHIVTTMRSRAPDGARHLSRSAVQRAIILLIEAGWLVRRFTGKGRSGSRYVPVLNVLELAAQGSLPSVEIDSVPLYRDANEESVASHSTGTEVSHSTGTLSDAASHLLGQRPSYINPSTDGVTCKEDNECAAPSAPLSVGLVATDAETAQGKEKKSFEELYREYGVRAEIGAARRAYDELAPEAELHAAMMDSARAWREAAGESIERMHLRRWTTEQRYLEDPKGERKPRERKPKPAAKSKAKAKPVKPAKPAEPDNDNEVEEEPAVWIGDVGPFSPTGSFIAEITGSTVSWLDEYNQQVVLHLSIRFLRSQPAVEVDHTFLAQSSDEEKQKRGQAFLARIARCLDLGREIEDTEELHGRELRCNISKVCEVTYDKLFVPRQDAA
ncbi:hypothetical protein CIT26_30960 [Mesorhizobium temperatum]|uniref:Uncharacterized protein n=2 Tax=Mesorhizobium temperatum TaxID=241416 RepID=A0A271LAU5_9HYPH|nr:hypothetical protein CIT26_30960 [Mesorhizobium temperatum]